MNTHYLFLAFHNTNGEHEACFHNFQAPNDDAAWETVERYLNEKGITTIITSALEGFPTEAAMSNALETAMRMLMTRARPARVNVNVRSVSAR